MRTKRKQTSNKLLNLILWIIVLILPYLCYRSFTLPMQFPDEYSEKLLLICAAVYLCVFLAVLFAVQRLPEKGLVVLGYVMIACAAAVQLYIADQMQLLPEIDLFFTIDQNKAMVEEGLHAFTNKAYFSVNTNNIPLTIVIYWVFRLAKALGFHNYELAGGIFNVGMNLLTYMAGYGIIRRVTSERPAFLLLVVLLTNPALYAYASYYYTDTISLGLTTFAIYLFVCAVRATGKSGKRQLVLFVLSGAVLFWAAKVRVTSLFVLIAAVVYAVIMGEWKKFLKTSIPVMAGLLAGMALYLPLYHYQVPFDTRDTDITWQHFVAMGSDMETTGRYNQGDYEETCEQPTHEEKVAYNVAKWKKRVRENGIAGSWTLICNKEATVWSYGSKQYYQYVQFVKDKQPIYDWIEGEHAIYFRTYMQAYNSLSLSAILASMLAALLIKKQKRILTCVAAIDWLGAVMFYVLWEAHPRQSVSYLFLMTMLLIPLFEVIIEGRLLYGNEIDII